MHLRFLFKASLLVVVFALGSCKYEEGPKLSLRSKSSRAVNIWILDKALENGTDKTNDYKNAFVNYQAELKEDKSYVIQYRPFNTTDYTEKGTWKFSSDKTSIEFTPENKSDGNPWKILRLKSDETWVVQTINGKEVELHMVEKP